MENFLVIKQNIMIYYNNRVHPAMYTQTLWLHCTGLCFHCKCTLIVHYMRESTRFSSARQPFSRILRNFCQYIARFRHAKNGFYCNKHVHACKVAGIVEEPKDSNIYY